MATIEKRNPKGGAVTYRVKIRLKGYAPQSATFNRLTDAKRWAQDTESAIRDGRHFKTAEAKKHTFNDLIDKYCLEVLPNYNEREQKERRSKLKWWSEGLGHYLLSDLTASVISERKSQLKRSPATIDKYLKNLSHLFTMAVNEWEWVEVNPVKKIKKPKLPRGRVRFLDDDERQRLLKACKESSNPVLHVCVVLAISTGMRKGEQMELKWKDVNLKEGFLILHETKNDDRRRIPLVSYVLESLKQHSRVRRLDTDLLFPSKKKDKPIDLRRPFSDALKRAKITDFHWHDLRHCAGSYLAMNGASGTDIAEVLGHKTLQMVKRYSHLSESHVSSVVESMNSKIFGEKE